MRRCYRFFMCAWWAQGFGAQLAQDCHSMPGLRPSAGGTDLEDAVGGVVARGAMSDRILMTYGGC
jgi:hypothetical protein